MSSKADYFLNKVLGEDFLESLNKVELWKPGTRTTIDHEEIKTALQIVPRAIMALLIKELAPLAINESKEFELPLEDGPALISATKMEKDVYVGNIQHNNKIVVDFKYRSIPGIGLVILSAFELYDVNSLSGDSSGSPIEDELSLKVQQLVDERMALHDLVGKVVDKKLEQKDAVKDLLLRKLSQIAQLPKINKDSTPQSDQYFRGMTNGLEVASSVATGKEPKFVESPKKDVPTIPLKQIEKIAEAPVKKASKFREFMEKKRKPKEFSVRMVKGETIDCPDCGNVLISNKIFTGCVCLGDSNKLFIKKSEDGIKIRFSRGWEQENIEMLLEILRKQNESSK